MTADRPQVGAGLPYGAVMATGAASELAQRAGVAALRLPLLWAAVVMALAVAGRSLFGRLVRPAGADATSPAQPHLGQFTVPLGLAVIGTGLARLHGSAALPAACVAVGLGWLTTVVLMARVLWSPVWLGIATVDGTWFLVPAALLGDASGTGALIARVAANARPVLRWLALVVMALGVLGYVVVLALAAVRIDRKGLVGRPHAPWWIAAGCGGLAAAAVGAVSAVPPFGHGGSVLHSFGLVALGLWVVASCVLVPVLAGSARFLLRLRHPAGDPPWPPAFSTGVYALGAGQASRLLSLSALATVADVAAAATLVIWALTVVAHLAAVPRLLLQR